MNQQLPPLPSSPCIKVCRLDPGQTFCEGCGRSREEIAAWSQADSLERRRIIESGRARLALKKP